MRLLSLSATIALALMPLAAEAGITRTIGLHAAPPALGTGITARPMIQFTGPLIAVPAAPATPPVVGEGGYDPGTPAGEGGYDPGTGPEPADPPHDEEENDSPFKP